MLPRTLLFGQVASTPHRASSRTEPQIAHQTDLIVYDARSCKKLHAELMSRDDGSEFIQVTLPQPVATDAEGRVRIDKTYTDDRSYFSDESTGPKQLCLIGHCGELVCSMASNSSLRAAIT